MNNVFERRFIDVPELKVGEKITLHFKSIGTLPKVFRIDISCHCFTYSVKPDGIHITYKASPIPVHLKAKGTYSTSKSINILFADKRQEALTFRVKVVA